MKYNANFVIIMLAVVVIGGGIIWGTRSSSFGGTGAGSQADACTVNTVTMATVGNQISSTILSAHANRAWARIQQPINATNTVNVAANAGAAATRVSGLQLPASTTTSPVPYLDMGLATDFPYTGAVTGITDSGSSTVEVTECLY